MLASRSAAGRIIGAAPQIRGMGESMRVRLVAVLAMVLAISAAAQQSNQSTQPSPAASKEKKQTSPKQQPEKKAEEAATKPTEPAPSQPEAKPAQETKEEHYDMAEVAPVLTHHQVTVNGKALKYTAAAERLPIKRSDGKIEAQMFFVAYSLDGEEVSKRPLTFAF